MSNSDKQKIIEQLLADVKKKFGEGALIRLGDEESVAKVDVIPTGVLPLDIALGVGGIPRGRITEIYGIEASGKTTLALTVIAMAQKMGGIAGYIDAEHALDLKYASMIGVDVENLLVSQPSYGEEALEILDHMVRSNAIDVVVVDSVAALVPRGEIEGSMGDTQIGAQARLMSQAMRKLAASINKTKTAVIFINQIRHKIGIAYGSPETTTGGNALKFYASIRIDVRKSEVIKKANEPTGSKIRVKVVKNKVAPPFKTAEFIIYFNEGISREMGILEQGLAMGIIKRAGTFFSYKDLRLGQGKENARNYLKEHPEVALEIENTIRKHYGLDPIPEDLFLVSQPEESTQDASDTLSTKKTKRTNRKSKTKEKDTQLPLDELVSEKIEGDKK